MCRAIEHQCGRTYIASLYLTRMVDSVSSMHVTHRSVGLFTLVLYLYVTDSTQWDPGSAKEVCELSKITHTLPRHQICPHPHSNVTPALHKSNPVQPTRLPHAVLPRPWPILATCGRVKIPRLSEDFRASTRLNASTDQARKTVSINLTSLGQSWRNANLGN
jgi:hypothetical protein